MNRINWNKQKKTVAICSIAINGTHLEHITSSPSQNDVSGSCSDSKCMYSQILTTMYRCCIATKEIIHKQSMLKTGYKYEVIYLICAIDNKISKHQHNIIHSQCGKYIGISCKILSHPYNIVIDLNNVMHWFGSRRICQCGERLILKTYFGAVECTISSIVFVLYEMSRHTMF